MKIVSIVQARMGSTRLPGKVLKKIVGIPALEILLKRLSRSKLIGEICLATSQNIENDQLCDVVEAMGYRVIRVLRLMFCNDFMTPLLRRQPISSSELRAIAL